jgi:hypothetical protein
MDVSNTSAIERIARVLAGQRLSANAEGDDPSAANAVNMEWEVHLDDAVAIMKTLREPDAEMARAGDPRVWEAMVRAGLAAYES